MEIDRLLLSPACYCTTAMPLSLTAWLCLNMYTSVEHDFCTTCYERPPVLSDRFCWAEGVVAQDRFYCISNIISHLLNEAARCGLHNRNLGNVVMDVFIYFIYATMEVFHILYIKNTVFLEMM